MQKNKIIYYCLIALNLIILPMVAFLIYAHFKPEATDFCTLGEQWRCDVVNKSIYSTIFGIPVAIPGLLTYLALLGFSIRGLKKDQTKLIPYALAFVGFGVLFSLYLTYVEAFILHTYCIFCVAQQLVILIQFGLFAYLFKITRKS